MFYQRSSCAPKFYLKLFEHRRHHIQSVQNFVFIVIYFIVLILWVIEFWRIFELYKIHWISQNWLTILQRGQKSKAAYATKHFEFLNSFWWQFLICLFLLLWQKPLKINLFFTPKYRSQLLGSVAKISVSNCIMAILLYLLLVIFNKNMYK